jgi:hypothetical protein
MTGKQATAEAKERFLAALEASHGNVRTAANLASVGRRSVYRWFTADRSFRCDMAIRYLVRADEIQEAALDAASRRRGDAGLLLTLAIMSDRYSLGLLDEQAVRRLGIPNVTEEDLNRERTERELLNCESPSGTRLALSRLRKRNAVLGAIVKPPRRWRPR